MPKLVLIQYPDVVICVDLAQTVLEAWPDATVVMCRGLKDVLASVQGGKVVDMFVLRQSMRGLREINFVQTAHAASANVLLTAADEHEADLIAAAGWRSLDMPFTTEHLLEALKMETGSARA